MRLTALLLGLGALFALPLAAFERDSSLVAPEAVYGFIEAVEAEDIAVNSFMLVVDGSIAAEGYWAPFQREDFSYLASLSKGYYSTAIGFAVQEGLLTLDDKVISFFPDDLPEVVSDRLAALTVRDMLRFRTGHTLDTARFMWSDQAESPEKMFFERPLEHEPGSHFLYNNGIPYMLGRIIEKVSGERFIDYIGKRLFEPLGIKCAAEDVKENDLSRLQIESIARFGQFLLQKGEWNGEQLLNREWIEAATSWQGDSVGHMDEPDWLQGFGYMFWMCQHGFFRGDGSHCQFMVVMRELNAVLVITGSHQNYQKTLDVAYATLVAGLREGFEPESRVSGEELAARLAALEVRLPSVVPALEAGEYTLAFEVDENSPPKSWQVRVTESSVEFNYGDAGVTTFPIGSWDRAQLYEEMLFFDAENIYIRAAWSRPDELTLYAFIPPFRNECKYRFDGGKVAIKGVFGKEYTGVITRNGAE